VYGLSLLWTNVNEHFPPLSLVPYGIPKAVLKDTLDLLSNGDTSEPRSLVSRHLCLHSSTASRSVRQLHSHCHRGQRGVNAVFVPFLMKKVFDTLVVTVAEFEEFFEAVVIAARAEGCGQPKSHRVVAVFEQVIEGVLAFVPDFSGFCTYWACMCSDLVIMG
jgi:hypothetical protein